MPLFTKAARSSKRGRLRVEERSTFTSMRCSTNMQTAGHSRLAPYCMLCFLSHAPCMPVHVRVLVWSTCWKFKAPAHRQARLITRPLSPCQEPKGNKQNGKQPNPDTAAGRAWPAAIAQASTTHDGDTRQTRGSRETRPG